MGRLGRGSGGWEIAPLCAEESHLCGVIRFGRWLPWHELVHTLAEEDEIRREEGEDGESSDEDDPPEGDGGGRDVGHS